MNPYRLLFALMLVVWTWLLLKPNPVPKIIDDSLLEEIKFVLSKCVHAGSYAFLAWFGTFRMVPARWKWVWLGLVLHGILTEIGQYIGNTYFETHRHGCIQDVLIDSAGVALGAIGRLRWRSVR